MGSSAEREREKEREKERKRERKREREAYLGSSASHYVTKTTINPASKWTQKKKKKTTGKLRNYANCLGVCLLQDLRTLQGIV